MSVAGSRAITVDDVTPEWLTEVLRRDGVLDHGSVVAFEEQANAAFNSYTRHLTPLYEDADTTIAPARLLLKCSLPQAWAQRAGAREVAFYELTKALPDHPPVIVRCYDAVYDAESGNSHILLEELSDTHILPVGRDNQINFVDHIPSESTLTQVIEALARFHAYWWEHPLLGSSNAPIAWGCRDEEAYTTEIARRGEALTHLFVQEGKWLPPSVKSLYERALVQLFPLWQKYMRDRVVALSNLTVTHGDAYFANFLAPREGVVGTTYIIDWQCPETYRGPTDLVNMCATFWRREDRADGERELNILRRYHRTLLAHGVSGYSWDDLVRDYRLSILDWLWVAVQDCYDGSGKAYWWPKMECLIAAFEDWHCEDLFEESA